MFKVCKQIAFCYGHRLTRYEGKCRHLHGHDAMAEIEVAQDELDHRGMVIDFSDIKSAIKGWIDDEIDHKLLLHREDPIVPVLLEQGEPIFLMDSNPTAENIARLIYQKARSLNLPVIEVRVWESPTSCASYSE